MANLRSFVEEVRSNGLSRTNRFEVFISIPSILSKYAENLRIIQLFCEQASLPGIAYSTQGVRTFGELRETIYDRNFEDVTLTFLVDRKMKVRDFFNEWSNTIIDPSTRISGYYREYVSNIVIKILDTKDQVTYRTTLVDAFPKAIQSITIDNNSKDVMRLPVTFNYRNHYSTGSDELRDDVESTPVSQIELPYFEDFYLYQTRKDIELEYIKGAGARLERQSFVSGRGGFIR